ncbi:MAG: hypothetical protein BWY83_03019 [bacterium ADurb.Bin478]|nr:MAG: hypothetical protein BWY83_03019 [bacterium ADurb.Bin478]
MADHAQPGELPTQRESVHAGLPFQRQHAVHADGLQPRRQAGDIAVGVHNDDHLHLFEPLDELDIVGRHELFAQRPRDHRAVIKRHVLSQSHKSRATQLFNLLQHSQVEREQILVHTMDQLRLVIIGQHEIGEPHKRAREPEKPLQGDPHHRIALALAHEPRLHGEDG